MVIVKIICVTTVKVEEVISCRERKETYKNIFVGGHNFILL